MIINVRLSGDRRNIIASYLLKNKEENGYDSFCSTSFVVKNQTKLLSLIKNILTSENSKSIINADTFIEMIADISDKSSCNTHLQKVINSINRSITGPMSLSQLYFNNRPVPKIKLIHTINNNMYFMMKSYNGVKKSAYDLEIVENSKIKCVISINNLVGLYRITKAQQNPKNKATRKNIYKKYASEKFNGTLSNLSFDGNVSFDDVRAIYETVTINRPTEERIHPPLRTELRNPYLRAPNERYEETCQPARPVNVTETVNGQSFVHADYTTIWHTPSAPEPERVPEPTITPPEPEVAPESIEDI